MDLEQALDGMVARMVRWVNGGRYDDWEPIKPIRAGDRPATAPAVATKPAPRPKAKAAEAKKPAAKPKAKPAATRKTAAAKAAAPPARTTAGPITPDVVAALNAAGGSATLTELVERTGKTRYALRQELQELIAAGRAQRAGAGLKTQYQLVTP